MCNMKVFWVIDLVCVYIIRDKFGYWVSLWKYSFLNIGDLFYVVLMNLFYDFR